MSFRPTVTNFNALDLLYWHEEGSLILSPKFQRRSVWSTSAKSSFVDSVLSGYPVPPLHIRLTTSSGRRAEREVIDGQQRLRSLFDFMTDELRLSRSIGSTWAGFKSSDLNATDQASLNAAEFVVYQYTELGDEDVLEIFSRLNTYSVGLNAQELRNGKYFGRFKRQVYRTAHAELPRWRRLGLFNETQIARMLEAEFVSELFVLQFDGFQDKKTSLDYYYAGLDARWPASSISLQGRGGARFEPRDWLTSKESVSRCRRVLDMLEEALGESVSSGPFRRKPLFYTLYAVVYHHLYGLPGKRYESPLRTPSQLQWRRLDDALGHFAEVLQAKAPESVRGRRDREFFIGAAQQTDNVAPRRARFNALWERTAV